MKKFGRDTSLDDLLDEKFGPPHETIGEVSRFCRECKTALPCVRTAIWSLPKILIVHLERFGYTPSTGRRFKRDDPVTVPASFVRFDKDAKGASGDRATYDLYAWTDHHGSDDSCGHYTAHSRHLDGLFYKYASMISHCHCNAARPDGWCVGLVRFDDARVTKAEKPTGSFTSKSAYVLFYERR